MLDNLKSQMRKGILEYCILLIVSKKEVYPSEIMEKLHGAKLIVVEGTIYPLLTRMKNNGLLSYRWQESTQGPPRKYFTITEEGRQLLKELDKEWGSIAESISNLKE